uniref:Uncharacterized protein n=1 Tax=Setaria italica TaxID=4555 RepID=K3ZYY1_SETIT
MCFKSGATYFLSHVNQRLVTSYVFQIRDKLRSLIKQNKFLCVSCGSIISYFQPHVNQ